ncbi:regulator of G protein signaling domain protein, partial [Cooperia oncophora]
MRRFQITVALLDARNIFSRYIDTDAACSISLPKKISERIFDRLSEQPISSDIFDEAKNFVHSLFDLRYFKDFENSLYHKKYQLQVFSRWCSLDDILYVPALLNAFLEFVDDRHDHDCLQFLLACNAFEKNYDSLPDEEALEDAMSIYDKYFSMQAISPIQIGDTARRRMESEICSDGGRPLHSSFHSAKQYCFLRIHDVCLWCCFGVFPIPAA